MFGRLTTIRPVISNYLARNMLKKNFSTQMTHPKLKLGLCQILVGRSKQQDIEQAHEAVKKVVAQGANVVMLPECFNCPYSSNAFGSFQEDIPDVGTVPDAAAHPTSAAVSAWAKEMKVYIVAGSIPERGPNGLIYNTCAVYDTHGVIVAKHRKAHLFDIDIPGKMTFKESLTLAPGDEVTTFPIHLAELGLGEGDVIVGLGICYDIRFPEYALICAQRGAQMLLYPGAFNMTTGPAHWELLQRGRAVDNQCYVATCSPARRPESSYHAWGHSTIVSPWGEVIATTDHEPSVVVADLDFKNVAEMRQNIPISHQKRTDLYNLSEVKKQ